MKEALRRKIARIITMLGQPSSWRGITVVLTGAGVALSPAHSEAITAGGLMLAGLIGIVLEP
jgi:hypothetical protein